MEHTSQLSRTLKRAQTRGQFFFHYLYIYESLLLFPVSRFVSTASNGIFESGRTNKKTVGRKNKTKWHLCRTISSTLNRMDAEDGEITPAPLWAPRTSAESGRIRWPRACYKQLGTNAAVSLWQIR